MRYGVSPRSLAWAVAAGLAALCLLGRPAWADPPRAGLGAFLGTLEGVRTSLRPRSVVYVSCWLEALGRDAARLEGLGYRLRDAVGVEQFPDTPQREWLTLWERGA